MMRKSNRPTLLVSLLIIALFGTLLTGCRSTDTTVEASTDATAEASTEATPLTRIVVDALGREVEIPTEIKRVVPLANALRMMCYLQAQDLIVGVEAGEMEKSLVKAYNWINYETWKDLPIVGEGGSGKYVPYEEEIIGAAPDVIICGYDQKAAEDLQTKTGIPVVVINPGNLFEDDYDQSLRIIGEVCGKTERSEAVIAYIQSIEDELNLLTKDIPEDQKLSVYTGAVSFKGGHGIEGTYQNFPPFTAINAKCVFESKDDKSTGVVIDTELILKMNPDVIFLDPNNMSFVNIDFESNPAFYESLKAVQNNQVYSMLGYNWYHTNVEIALADCYYAATVLYPEVFKDINAVDKANEIFEFLLDAPNYYQDLTAVGFGFGPLKIGE